MDKLSTVKEVAKRLRVTPRTVHNYLNDGKLTRIKIGCKVLIKQNEVNQLIEKSKK